jgi:hypothetical protein
MKSQVKMMVSKVGDTQSVGANNFQKRELFGRDEGSQYPQDWKFEFVKDKTKLLDDVLEGTFVTVSYNIQSKKVESKTGGDDMYFVTLQGWKIDI